MFLEQVLRFSQRSLQYGIVILYPLPRIAKTFEWKY